MRVFTLIVSALFVVIGVWGILDGDSEGWSIAGFFAACLLVAILDPWLPKPWVFCGYRLSITEDEVACVGPRSRRKSIRWGDVIRIWYVTTSWGPWAPDEWLLFEGAGGGCSFPTEAEGMDGVWDKLKKHFAGFDYGPLVRGGTVDTRHLCWQRQGLTRPRT